MPGSLVLVATPIGNLGDISQRAIETLRTADAIACEDTRHTRKLLTHHNITGKKLLALHEHNELSGADEIVERVGSGQVIAFVSDAGMPTISDPGQLVVAACAGAGLSVSVIPGASAAISALAVSGLPTDRFCFEGFLPRKKSDRRRYLESMVGEERTMIFYESPHRIDEAAADLAASFGDDRRVALVRELTKMFEEVRRSTLGELRDQLDGTATKGECVLIVEGSTFVAEPASEEKVLAALHELVAKGMSKKDAAAAVSEDLGVPRRLAYDLATRK